MRGTIRYLSVCSGIEAASVACQHLGWSAVAFSELEPFPCAVLKHHYPHVPNIGDMTKIDGSKYHGTVDLIVGGTPCQSFSVAGKRGGISDPRGALALAFVTLVRDVSPRWIVWENVPGVFSSGDGEDFKAFTTALINIGYHVAWRVLDAQYFGVPQRRRRVFLVGHLGDWRPAAAVLFEPHSLRGHSAPRTKKAKNIAGTFTSCAYSGGASGRPEGAAYGHFIPSIVNQSMSCKWSKGTSGPAGDEHHNLIATTQYGEIAATLTSRNDGSPCCDRGPTIVAYTQSSHGGYREGTGTIRSSGGDIGGGSETIVAFHGSQDPDVSELVTHPLGRNQGQEVCIAIHPHCIERSPSAGTQGKEYLADGSAYTLDGRGVGTTTSAPHMQVRRLTPLECERLQGFPDHYTNITYRDKPAADGPRYKALGNSMAVPVMRWIFERIEHSEFTA